MVFRNSVIRLLTVFLLVCGGFAGAANAQETFVANLDASQVVGSTTETGTAVATFVLDSSEQNLAYTIAIFGLDLKPNPADRTGFSDIDKIHVHNAFPGGTGPHVLNIFGLPSEDDAELTVDFDNETISGVYNDADAIDPATGELFDQNSPFTTKLLSNFVDDLRSGQLYLAVHTAGQGGDIAIRGQLFAVPEPSSVVVLFALGVAGCIRRQR